MQTQEVGRTRCKGSVEGAPLTCGPDHLGKGRQIVARIECLMACNRQPTNNQTPESRKNQDG